MTHLFTSAQKYVIIYSSNFDGHQTIHYKDRNFTNWIETKMKDWELEQIIENKYKYDSNDPDNTTRSDFFIYRNLMPRSF